MHDKLKEMRLDYSTQDYFDFADHLFLAETGEFPSFVLSKRDYYVSRLHQMADEPDNLQNMQSLNLLKLFDRVTPKNC